MIKESQAQKWYMVMTAELHVGEQGSLGSTVNREHVFCQRERAYFWPHGKASPPGQILLKTENPECLWKICTVYNVVLNYNLKHQEGYYTN